MATPAIKVEGLGKKYRLTHGQGRTRYRTLRESLVDAVKAPFRTRGTTEEFWALSDVSFEVQPGDVVGVIGRNGAGKSTLLKVLSRITKPSKGRVEINGRVGSLLEVGTGFHPELTGRENIFLNGSILGMSRREIAARFDAIVAFAEVEQFLDTPVKRYSSGMYVRLAFAVAAHLEPEILIVDEVLAVGDAVFQRRCLDRIAELARGGCALLFVSHQLDLVSKYCRRAVMLTTGRLTLRGDVHTVLGEYRKQLMGLSDAVSMADRPRRGHGRAKFVSLRFLDGEGRALSVIGTGEDLRCVIDIESAYDRTDVALAVVVKTIEGARILTSWTEEVGHSFHLRKGLQRIECRFKRVPLRPGRQMVIELWMYDGELVDLIEDACILDVVARTPCTFSDRHSQGHALCEYEWASHPADRPDPRPE